jgi:MFS transporter, ACS family, glucarate transporter
MPLPIWRRLFTSPSLWAIAVLYVCGSFGFSFFISWLSKYLKDVQGVQFDSKYSDYISGLPLFCGGIACLIGGIASDALVRRTGRKWLWRAIFPLTGYGMSAASMFCMPYAQSPWQAAFLLGLAGFGNDFGQAANWATIVDIGGEYAGTAAGFINTVGNTGNIVQPYIGALVIEYWGWNALLAIYGTAFLVAGSMWLFIRPERTFYEGEPEADPNPQPAD